MRRLAHILSLTLAMNFVAAAGGVAWLWQTHRLDRRKMSQIRQIVMGPATQPATQPASAEPSSRPVDRLEAVLARHAGLPAAEQLEFIRRSFAAQMAEIDRRQQELGHREQQLLIEKQALARDRAALEDQRRQLATQSQQAMRLASDKGFRESLALYQSLPPRQVKTIFMGLDDAVVVRYLQAMEPRMAARITKEFKTPEELERLKTLIEKMRQQTADAKG